VCYSNHGPPIHQISAQSNCSDQSGNALTN
jgi:hypothetical protein